MKNKGIQIKYIYDEPKHVVFEFEIKDTYKLETKLIIKKYSSKLLEAEESMYDNIGALIQSLKEFACSKKKEEALND